MGYPDDALAADEELLLHCHPHRKMLVVPAIVFVLASAVAGFALGFAGSKLSDAALTVATAAIAAVWIAAVIWRSVVPFVRWQSTHFIVTDRRVLVREGVLTHTGIDIPLNRISNVAFRHGLLDRIVRTGTLVIASAAEEPLEFDDVPNVARVHALLYNEVFHTVL